MLVSVEGYPYYSPSKEVSRKSLDLFFHHLLPTKSVRNANITPKMLQTAAIFSALNPPPPPVCVGDEDVVVDGMPWEVCEGVFVDVVIVNEVVVDDVTLDVASSSLLDGEIVAELAANPLGLEVPPQE
jgi:hypothetical protein